MRTTVTLDPDVEALIDKVMSAQGVTFKQALNDAVRRGLARPQELVDTPTYRMGRPVVDLDRALRLAAELEDAEILQELESGR